MKEEDIIYMLNYNRNKIIRMSGVEPESIVDGPGFRYAAFVQGCNHACPGCHNPQTHDFNGGYDVTVGEVFDDIVQNPRIKGVTFSGGEPFEQVDALLELAKAIKANGLNLMCYSGYTYEELQDRHDMATDRLLEMLDILVDGRFVESLKNLELAYRGSENQRVIDMNKTRTDGKVVLYQSGFGVEL